MVVPRPPPMEAAMLLLSDCSLHVLAHMTCTQSQWHKAKSPGIVMLVCNSRDNRQGEMDGGLEAQEIPSCSVS
jgi:hypothetical protein